MSPAAFALVVLSGFARIIDGDTLELQGAPVRLAGIDAPEMHEPAGPASKRVLEMLTQDRVVECWGYDRDRYRRLVAICHVGGVDLGAVMIMSGKACRWVRFDREGRYAGLGCERR